MHAYPVSQGKNLQLQRPPGLEAGTETAQKENGQREYGSGELGSGNEPISLISSRAEFLAGSLKQWECLARGTLAIHMEKFREVSA